ncbi:MAG: lytic transglycosylase domain-containing protein, partial [Rhodospirillales bacterium]
MMRRFGFPAVALCLVLAAALAGRDAVATEQSPEAAPTNASPDDSAKSEPAKTEPAKSEPAKSEPAKAEPAKSEPAKKPPAKKTATPAKPAAPAKPETVRGAPAPANANAPAKSAAVGAAGRKPAPAQAPQPAKSAKPTPDAKQPKIVEPPRLKPLLGERERDIYKDAFAKAADGKWAEAQKLMAGAREKLPAKLLRALELGAGGGDLAQVMQFMSVNPDWPYLGALRQRAEEAMAAQPDRVLLDWFEKHPPQTLKGDVALAEALRRAGKEAEADGLIRDAWIYATLDAREERQFFDRYRRILRDQDHVARQDRLMWDSQVPAAQRMMQRVDERYRLLATARIRMIRLQGGLDAAIARVPEDLRNDPGLVYERLRYRRRKGDFEGARELLLNLPHDLRRPSEWWTELSYVIRRTLDAGDASLAYRIAKAHRQDAGATLAEAEFLAGWISLRFLRDTAEAREHFKTLYQFVRFPVSRARAAYWRGRTAEAESDQAAAEKWYREGATHLTTFYGQLSARRLRLDTYALPPEPEPSKEQAEAFERAELPRLVRMMAEIGERERVNAIFRHMSAVAREPHEHALIARLATQMDLPDQAVRAARRAERAGAPLTVLGYPTMTIRRADDRLDPALIHALIRQESGFDSAAVSRAGARGLMQLMPDTARLVAREMKVGYQPHLLTDDTALNMMLGRAYLKAMIEEMGGVPAGLAAYNAGPSRAKRWMRSNGDPRVDEDALVDWIELIPIYETRDYVQRVLE